MIMQRKMSTDPYGAAEVNGMNEMPLEPDSPDTDPPLSAQASSVQWQTDGGSHLDMVIDQHCWPDDVVHAARPRLAMATDIACETFDWPRLEIGALFCGDDRIRDLNLQFRGKDSPTNVLSFPSDDDGAMRDPDVTDPVPLAPGEIAIAYETLHREAVQESKTVDDHLVHLWVHGLLHLMGHDHEADEEADIMEAGEIRVLAMLGIANPYADFREDITGETG